MITLLLLLNSVLTAFSQVTLDQLVSNFEKFQSESIHPNIRLALNQSVFSPGDTVFYKLYLMDQHHLPVAGRNLFRIHVANFRGEMVSESISAVSDGRGASHFLLPETLPAGLYTIIVENPWLKKVVPPAIYEREIVIVRERMIRRKELKAFVEGGGLVRTFPNKVVFRGPANSLIQVENSNGQIVDACETDRFGLAHVVINPADGHPYFAVVPSQSLRTEIPFSAAKYGLRFRDREGDFIIADLTYTGMDGGRKLYVIVTGRGKIRYRVTIEAGNGINTVRIPTEGLAGGINTLTLLTEEGKVVAFRNFYHQSKTFSKAEILVSRAEYKTRQEVQIEAVLSDVSGKPLRSEFTFWALNGNVLGPEDVVFPLTELDIPISRIDTTMLGTYPRLFSESLDDYCITQHGVDWDAMLKIERSVSDSYRSVFYRQGRVFLNGSNDPAPDNTQVLFYFQHAGLHYQTFTLNGIVQITIPEFYGEEKLFYMAEDPGGTRAASVKIEWDLETYKASPSPAAIEGTEPSPYGQFASKRQSIDQAYQFFSQPAEETDFARQTDASGEAVFKFEDKVEGADVTVNLGDYQRFNSLREVIKEIIPALKFRIRKDKPTIRMDLEAAVVPKDGPLFIIDGFPTLSTELFLTLQPDGIESIQIIRSELKLRKLGLMGKNGVVIVNTHQAGLHKQLQGNMDVIHGIRQRLPVPDTDQLARVSLRYPVFRSTLCWVPSQRTDASGKSTVSFYTTDDAGPVYLFIVGITKDGETFFASKRIIVNASN